MQTPKENNHTSKVLKDGPDTKKFDDPNISLIKLIQHFL